MRGPPRNVPKLLTGSRCLDGKSGPGNNETSFDCSGIDLLGFVPLADLGNYANRPENASLFEASDIWGWTDVRKYRLLPFLAILFPLVKRLRVVTTDLHVLVMCGGHI